MNIVSTQRRVRGSPTHLSFSECSPNYFNVFLPMEFHEFTGFVRRIFGSLLLCSFSIKVKRFHLTRLNISALNAMNTVIYTLLYPSLSILLFSVCGFVSHSAVMC